ncbi:MAG: hypothetical protein GX643_18305 [Acidimicrobiales bacterium]|nr:hypothetical protein [Acidimicrobiales bacterium]
MSLADWQSRLVELASRGTATDDTAAAALDASERGWFASAALHPGAQVTRDVVHDLRWRRVVASAPLTLLALRRCGLLDGARTSYLAETFTPSSRASAEGRQFLADVHSRWGRVTDGGNTPDRHHLATIVALERAVLAARTSTWTTNIRASRPDDAVAPGIGGLVAARCDAAALLRRLLANEPLPAPGSGHGAFLVAPGLAGGFREASPSEIRALTLVGEGCPVSEVAGLWPRDLIDPSTLVRLESIGALVRQPSVRAGRGGILSGSPA